MTMHRTLALAALLPLAACASTPDAPPLPETQERFWQALSSHCGEAYEGALASSDARDADWEGRQMIAHWAACDERKVAIAFHVQGDTARAVPPHDLEPLPQVIAITRKERRLALEDLAPNILALVEQQRLA